MPTDNLKNLFVYLPEFYEKAGFARYSENLMPRLLQLAQESGWIGRRVMDLACGVGTAAIWLGKEGFRVIGVDMSGGMLIKARNNAQATGSSTVNWRQQDIRELDYSPGTLDLVTCLQALNYMQSLRDLERVFAHAFRVLAPDKLFIFDMETIEGLATRWGTGHRVPHDDGKTLTIVIQSTFSYEALINSRRYVIFYDDGTGWQRVEEEHVLRGYPIQAVTTLLERAGFAVGRVLNLDLEPLDPANDPSGRAIFIVRKPAGSG